MSMSKLLDYIKVTATQERRLMPQPLKMVEVKHTSERYNVIESAIVHRVEARLGVQVAITDEMMQQGDWERIIKHKVYAPLAETIFGEFRAPLLEADLACLEGDYDKASQIIRGVLDSMFKV